jgi:lipopolysaccharide export system protein LptC
MPQDATPSLASGRPRGRAAVDTVADRDKAFRKAGRHTSLVRSMRLLLPIAAVMTLASYGLYMQRSIKVGFGGKTIEASSFSISREALVAHDPRYTGFDKQGGAFEVRAKTAEQDLKLKGIVRLKGIDANMIDVSRNRTDMKAVRGVLDTNTNVLELAEQIDVVSQNGMTADLTQATIYTKENRIVSNEPVVVRMPSGTVRGKAMTIEQRERKIQFSGGVVANLRAQPKAGVAKAGDPALRGGQDAAAAARNDTPVDITSNRLLIDDTAKTATFVGNVVAKQNDQVLETTELEVFYDGQPAAQSGGQPASQAKTDPAAGWPS